MTRLDYRDYHTSDVAVGAYHDTYATGYYAAQWKQLEQPLLRMLFDEERAKGAKSMLDIACGQGRITLVGAEYFSKVRGVDYSPQMLERAKQARAEKTTITSDLQFDVGDVRTFSAGELFDVVTAFRFFLNAEDDLRIEGLRCVRRNIAPTGVFIANVHVAASSPLACFYGVSNTARRMLGKRVSAVRNSISLGQFKRMLAAEGFRVDRVYRYSLLPRVGSLTDGLAERSIAAVDRVGQFIPGMSLLSQAFLVCAKPV
ncbi:MAG: class I SAM-dependent methyltransferase [Pirellulales bacterium]